MRTANSTFTLGLILVNPLSIICTHFTATHTFIPSRLYYSLSHFIKWYNLSKIIEFRIRCCGLWLCRTKMMVIMRVSRKLGNYFWLIGEMSGIYFVCKSSENYSQISHEQLLRQWNRSQLAFHSTEAWILCVRNKHSTFIHKSCTIFPITRTQFGAHTHTHHTCHGHSVERINCIPFSVV